MKQNLNNGLTISVIDGPGAYAGENTVEIAFWPTDSKYSRFNEAKWVVPEEFKKYSRDGQVCSYVPQVEVDAYIKEHS